MLLLDLNYLRDSEQQLRAGRDSGAWKKGKMRWNWSRSYLPTWNRPALAQPRLPPLFSKSMGFTLWSIVEDPISPDLVVYSKFQTWNQSVFSYKGRIIYSILSFISDADLLKVTQRYVAPYIPIKVNQYIVELDNCMKKFCHVVMGFYLQNKQSNSMRMIIVIITFHEYMHPFYVHSKV